MTTTILIVMLIGSTVILSSAAGINRLLHNSSSACRFSIWQIAITSLLILPIGVFFLPEIPLGLVSNTQVQTRLSLDRSSLWEQPISLSSLKVPSESGSQRLYPTPPLQSDTVTTKVLSPTPRVVSSPSPYAPYNQTFRFSVSEMVVSIWLALALVLLLRTLLAHFRVAWVALSANDDLEFVPTIGNGRNWLPASVELTYSNRHTVPFTIGILRRRIILPSVALNWSTDQFRMVLKHELAHVLRRDVLWQLITSIVTNLFWFQPLTWWANRELKIERERACDDQVIAGGEHAADYATMLVQLAANFSGRTTIPAGALSMAQKPIERRIATILSPSTSRSSTNRWLSSSATAIALMIVATVCSIRPFAPLAVATPVREPVQSSVQEPQVDDAHFPIRLTGLVVDENDKPVVGAKLQLTATPRPKSEAYHFDYKQDTFHLPVVMTDGMGKFVVNLGEFSNDLDIWSIRGKVIAENRPTMTVWKTVRKDAKPDLVIRTIRFPPGKKIRGRIVPPEGNSELSLNNPVITVRPTGLIQTHQWQGATVKCPPDGRFEVMIASDVHVSIQATADNFAGTGLKVLPHVRNLHDIPLQEGTTLKGQVLDRAGRPVAGVLVYSESEIDTQHWNPSAENPIFQPRFVRFCKSDANGEFELEPQTGKVRVSLRSSIWDPKSNTNKRSDKVPPVTVPLQIDLAKSGLEQSINLREAKTVRASGTIQWPDGSPAIAMEATVGLMIGSSGIQVFSTKTNNNGRYTVLIPENMQSIVSVFGARISANEYHYAIPSTTSKSATQQSLHILGLAPLSGNVSGLDWKLVERKAVVRDKKTPAEDELQGLLTKGKSDKIKNRFRIAGATNDQEREALVDRYENSNKLHTASLIAFEAKHRGEFAGAIALANYIDLEQPEQLDAFTANYLDSPNADVVFSDIDYPNNLVHARKMLNTFSGGSPYAAVQAAAMFQEAMLIAQVLMNKEYFKLPQWRPQSPKPKTNAEKLGIEKVNQILAELISCDAEQLFLDYDSILTTMKTEYPEHGNTVIHSYSDSMRKRRTDGVDEPYASHLQKIRFSLYKLKSGQPLPHLTGRDVSGVEFDSERLKGKAVLLFFTSNLYTDQSNFKELRELKKQYEGRPFEIVSVMVDSKLEEAKSAVDTGKITWPTLYDVDQQLMKKWQFDPCSERLLIDHQGIIHRRAFYGTELDETIELLVRNAERK